MKSLWVFITVPLLALAACSVSKTDEKDQKLDKFEQRNVVGSAPSQAAVAKEERFARMALTCINQQYPNKISHVLNSAADVAQPVQLTPAFYGCFDWHSAVHGHWLLVRLWGLDKVSALEYEKLFLRSTPSLTKTAPSRKRSPISAPMDVKPLNVLMAWPGCFN
ncbi:MAG: DUF2891 family protein [Parasphingorhabdus sp.]|nr:DUF2891 family protein [Parasphingorhabdus sp.]